MYVEEEEVEEWEDIDFNCSLTVIFKCSLFLTCDVLGLNPRRIQIYFFTPCYYGNAPICTFTPAYTYLHTTIFTVDFWPLNYTGFHWLITL